MKSRSLLVHLIWAVSTLSLQAEWPQFRGPGSRGVAPEAAFPEHWSASKHVLWTVDVPGLGWSSPIVWGNRVIVTTAVSSENREAPRKGLYLGGERPEAPTDAYDWIVLCVDANSGRERWRTTVHSGAPPTGVHVKNSYASETPVTDGEHVFAYFGNIGVFALTMEGKPVWSARFNPVKTKADWGTAASPVLHQGRLYIVNDNEGQSWLAAFDSTTGKQIWRIDRDEKSNWATPFVWENSKRTEIVTPGSGRVRSYSTDGRELWSLRGMSSITIPTPFADGDLLYVCSGFVASALKPIYAIRPGGSGDLSLKPGVTESDHIVWCNWSAAPYNPSPLLYRGILYVLLDRGMLSAYDAKTGDPMFEKQRIRGGRAFTASPWAARDRIYCMNENGHTFVLDATETFRLLHVNRLVENEMALACPAVAGDKLIIRTASRLYCIGSEAD